VCVEPFKGTGCHMGVSVFVGLEETCGVSVSLQYRCKGLLCALVRSRVHSWSFVGHTIMGFAWWECRIWLSREGADCAKFKPLIMCCVLWCDPLCGSAGAVVHGPMVCGPVLVSPVRKPPRSFRAAHKYTSDLKSDKRTR
jgi:hypothetical protein